MSSPRKGNDDATGLLPFGDADDPAPPPSSASIPVSTDGETLRRVFLGWNEPALPAAADWLLAQHGTDMDGLLVALPGGRAVRRLADLLARRAAPGWRPPRLLTQGHLIDELVTLERPPAGRLARTLAWRRALDVLTADELERLARGATERKDPESRLRLAETVRTLHGELAPDGLDFEDLARRTRDLGHESEGERWHVLAKAQRAWRKALAACDLEDPHEGRRAALEAGRVDTGRDVVLVGVADMNELLAGVLVRLGARATALIVAPEQHAAGFDDLGRLVAPYWTAQEVPLDDEHWFVEEKPGDQADRALDCIAGWAERRRAEEITVGLADEEVIPYLERRLSQAEVEGQQGRGARLRVAAGTPLSQTRPFKLLRATCDVLERGGFSELAELARHPDAAPLLGGDDDAADILDTYHIEHLPRRLEASWPGTPEATGGMRRVTERWKELVGTLAARTPVTLDVWSAEIRALLERVYGRDDTPLDPEVEAERVLAGSLRAIAKALEELAAVPAELAGTRRGQADGACAGHEALRILLRALRAEAVPPAPARSGEPTLEGLGWLELMLDDAPAMVVTGFNEGRVPESIQGDAFLPDALRAQLGLPDNEARLARDVYAARAMLAQRADIAFVTGRRARSGDPLVPSRIAFQVAADRPRDILMRVRRFLPPEVAPEPETGAFEEPASALARAPEAPPVERMSVTSFRAYLNSPYLFYLERVLRLRSRHDRARELDPMQFGTFAHDILQDFAERGPRDSTRAEDIEAFLVSRVEEAGRARFGADPLPAIALQLDQLAYRMRYVARVQARRRQEGWHLVVAEWSPEGGVPFDVDGTPIQLTGKIDRVDRHDDGRWAILDYKTGEVGSTPDKAARDKYGWKDLQLPLYRVLAGPLAAQHGLEGTPELGYFQLGKDETQIAVRLATEWTEGDHEEALDVARDVVRKVRAGRFFELGRAKPFDDDHIFRALVGKGLLNGPLGEATP